ncbi:MAG: histidine phosphatase family protein [Dehalococcoidia bacterium]
MVNQDVEFNLYFIRHGESESNVAVGLAAGKNFDAPMTERGHQQALALGRRLAREGVTFERIYSSSLVRAVQTTEGMLKGMKLESAKFERIDHIIEQQIPAWRGMPLEDVMTPEVTLMRSEKGKWFQPADGESERAVERRISNWLEDEILYNPGRADRPGSHRIAVVAHGHSLRCLFHYIMGFDQGFIRRMQLDNTSISRFRFGRDGWTVNSINDAAHTGDLGDVNRERTEAMAAP